MTWYAWVLVAVTVWGSIATIMAIGKARKPMTSGTAVTVVVINVLFIWAIVALAERCS